mgnify:CR=1 FL=1
MKKIIFLIFFINLTICAAELSNDNTSIFTITKETKLPDGTLYQTFDIKGGSTYNTGKYAISNCSGHRINKKNRLLELRNVCEIDFDDGNKIWTELRRTKSDTSAGVGKWIILDGTGNYSDLKGKECVYAVSFYKDLVFTKSKCNISDVLFEKLKK